ncbi:hypothetical protein ACMHYB_39025 [Sorangium sp. So ce1128]
MMSFIKKSCVDGLLRGGITNHTYAVSRLLRHQRKLAGIGWDQFASASIPRWSQEALIEDRIRDTVVLVNAEIAASPDRADDVLRKLHAILSMRSDVYNGGYVSPPTSQGTRHA